MRHSVGEYVNGMANTNGIESFWATLKRAHKGNVSQDQQRSTYTVTSGSSSAGITSRDLDTIHQMEAVVRGMDKKRLMYKDLIA